MNDAQKYLNRVQLVIDIIAIVVLYLLAWVIRFRTILFGSPIRGWYPSYYLGFLFFVLPLFLILNYAFGLYSARRLRSYRGIIFGALKANVVGGLILILVIFMIRMYEYPRSVIVIFGILNLIVCVISRCILTSAFKKHNMRDANKKRVLLVGYSSSAQEYIKRTKAYPECGYKIVGILDDTMPAGETYRGVKCLGATRKLEGLLARNKGKVEEIAIALGLSEYYRLGEIVKICEKAGVHTKFIPDYYNIISTRPHTEDFMGLPIINIRYVPLSAPAKALAKRLMDIVISVILIGIFSPVMLFVVIGIKTTMPGPLIFRQIRVGLHNAEFEMMKFRSMRVQTEEEEKKGWTTKNDPRVTKFGKLIRKTSIDEIPQFFNVLKGDMSIVGPRPERPQFVEKFKEEIPRYMIKHQVRPGITGWAQVNGFRGDTSIEGRIECDLFYIENWTLGLDFKILLMTVTKGFVNKNAY